MRLVETRVASTAIDFLAIVASLSSYVVQFLYKHIWSRRGRPSAGAALFIEDTCARGLFMPDTRVAIAGLGAIGRVLARKLTDGGIQGITAAG